MFDLTSRQKLNRGYSDGLSRAMEIVLTPLLMGFVGSLIDGWLGTRPLFMLGLGALGAAGIIARMWLGYDREMRKHEAKLPGARSLSERLQSSEPTPERRRAGSMRRSPSGPAAGQERVARP